MNLMELTVVKSGDSVELPPKWSRKRGRSMREREEGSKRPQTRLNFIIIMINIGSGAVLLLISPFLLCSASPFVLPSFLLPPSFNGSPFPRSTFLARAST